MRLRFVPCDPDQEGGPPQRVLGHQDKVDQGRVGKGTRMAAGKKIESLAHAVVKRNEEAAIRMHDLQTLATV